MFGKRKKGENSVRKVSSDDSIFINDGSGLSLLKNHQVPRVCLSCGRRIDKDVMICDNCGKVYRRPDFGYREGTYDEENALAEWYAVAVTGRKLINGVFWNIIRRENSMDYIKYIHQHNKMQVRFINEYSIVEADPKFVFQAISSVQEESIDNLWDTIMDRMALNQVEFEKFMVAKGIMEDGYCGKIAIFHTGGGGVLYNGIQIPEFNLTLELAMESMKTYGYCFRVGDEYISPEEASENEEYMHKLWNSLEVIHVRSAVLVEIKATLSSDEYRQIKKEMNMNIPGID